MIDRDRIAALRAEEEAHFIAANPKSAEAAEDRETVRKRLLAAAGELQTTLSTLAENPEGAPAVHAAIRAHLRGSFGDALADGLRILYGGSVKADNAATLFSQADIDGGLIGGAALKAAMLTWTPTSVAATKVKAL